MLYRNAVAVDSAVHLDLSVVTGGTYGFAAGVNSVPLTAIEFGQAAGEYPIVFAGADDAVVPCAMLGATGSSNAFVTEDGGWGGRYVPAFVRRYPFVFADEPSGKNLILHIDESFEGCNRDGRGERLFDNDGNRTQYLEGVLAFLQDYQQRFVRTRAYCNRLKELGLLRPMEATFRLPSGHRQSLSGFQTVDRERLKALPGSDLAAMTRLDELECTFLHLSSLRHFGAVAERYAAADLHLTPAVTEDAALSENPASADA